MYNDLMEILRPPEIFTTARLGLRIPRLEDAQTLFEIMYQDPRVVDYMFWENHTRVEQSENTMKRFIHQWETNTAYPWMIVHAEDKIPIGIVELRIEDFKAELGYVLAPSYWGQGMMSEVAQPLVDWAMSQPSIYRVWATCDVDNIGSTRVLEKVGMAREGILRRHGVSKGISSEPRDRYSYAIVK